MHNISIPERAIANAQSLPNLFPLPNGSGLLETYNINNQPISLSGSGSTLADVITFYDKRFNIGFTAQEKADLIAFLNALQVAFARRAVCSMESTLCDERSSKTVSRSGRPGRG